MGQNDKAVTLEYENHWGDHYTLALYKDSYAMGGGLAISALDATDPADGEYLSPWSDITVNIPDNPDAAWWCATEGNVIIDTNNNSKELVDALLAAFLYEFSDVLDRFADFRQQPYSAGSNVFRNFLSLLSSSYPKSRSVSYYADKLCLTPKYLSTVCKEASGETASELINRYVVKDIDFLLKQRGRSIKEICNELEFPNLSFFGRYVKKHLGLSPKQYREKVLGKEK